MQQIIKDLQWLKLDFDVGPGKEGQFGSLIQSERSAIYQEHAYKLLETGHAYRCFCDAKVLEGIRETSVKGRRQTLYDRRCMHLTESDIDNNLRSKIPYTIRFKVTNC
jgi:glutamyl-tRNA synthetase